MSSEKNDQPTEIAPIYGPMFGTMGSAVLHAFSGQPAAQSRTGDEAGKDEAGDSTAPPQD
ncbi:hypothetical protein OH807_31130 [Kitasatospora sp. NBC_01560]|uniref:hypothetical protein n=1 Tax=Kitasatospora sp. NBC_01560 TaxID=2975965 RepID=UPI003867441F